jgi:hypothetical protein
MWRSRINSNTLRGRCTKPRASLGASDPVVLLHFPRPEPDKTTELWSVSQRTSCGIVRYPSVRLAACMPEQTANRQTNSSYPCRCCTACCRCRWSCAVSHNSRGRASHRSLAASPIELHVPGRRPAGWGPDSRASQHRTVPFGRVRPANTNTLL